MKLIYDTETCGLVGMPVLIQYRTLSDEGVPCSPITLYHIWREPVGRTLDLIREFMTYEHIGFNLVFDHFQLCKLYSIFDLMVKTEPSLSNDIPDIKRVAHYEPLARDGACLRPVSACDLMLHARKNKYQITMERKPIRIRKVPTILAWDLAEHLNKLIKFDPILFAKSKVPGKWKVFDVKKKDGSYDKDFKDVVLAFKASGGLKHLVQAACPDLDRKVLTFKDVEVHKSFRPFELEYAPFAAAANHRYAKRRKKSDFLWPDVIKHHIEHWYYNDLAKTYATNDVIFTEALWRAFGCPASGDIDSELAICVAASRWRGYAINVAEIQRVHDELLAKVKSIPVTPETAKAYLYEVCSDIDKLALDFTSTGRTTLETIIEDPDWAGHPIVERAKEVVEARQTIYYIRTLRKLIVAGRLPFAAKIIGALTSRMSGDGKFNAQGVPRVKFIRKLITFSSKPDEVVKLGDFDGFEVTIADRVYNDSTLHQELLSGKKIHTIFAKCLYPELSEEQIIKSKGSKPDYYDAGKRGVFSQMYGGNHDTLVQRLKITPERAMEAATIWMTKYPGVGLARQKIMDRFASMSQPAGIGTRVVWKTPDDYVESLLGHRRYFTLENMVCKALFDLANNPLPHWKSVEGRVVRRDREQTIGGAIMSAIFASAFGIQAAMVRQAANHEIQSTGAQITKDFQYHIWKLQPVGINPWVVQPCNIHDELVCPVAKSLEAKFDDLIEELLEQHRRLIPLLNIEFSTIKDWSDK